METPALTLSPEQEITVKLKRPRFWPAILTLYVLGGLIPECVATFNTAPRSFLFNPSSFFFLTAFYGSANLLIRELIRSRPRRLACLLLLGIAFGFVNEGMIAGTWYTVVPDGYLLLGGIDWSWAVALTAFHTIYSIIIPIFLVEALFPTLARVPWLRRKGVIGFSVLFLLTTSLTFLLPTYRLERLLVLCAVVILVICAVRLPLSKHIRSLEPDKLPGLGRLRLAGFVGTLLYFGAILIVPGLLAHTLFPSYPVLSQILIILSILITCAFLLRRVRRWTTRSSWRENQALALITGALLPTTLLSLFLPQMWLAAQPAVTLPLMALLLWTAYRRRKANLTIQN
ncbi:MAG TPA: hypothetical protein VGD98_24870 [Ktedonobacteraceae bacterium]